MTYFLSLSVNKLNHEGESWFSKIFPSLRQFFTSIDFSWVKSTNQNFILGMFQVVIGGHGPHPKEILAWDSLDNLPILFFSSFWDSPSQSENQEQPTISPHFHCTRASKF